MALDILLRMATEHANEAQRLTENYGRMYDAELENLAADAADLTDLARQILAAEMKKRGLLERPAVSPTHKDSVSDPFNPPAAWEVFPETSSNDQEEGDPSAASEYSWRTLLCDCDSREEAWQIYEVLRRAGIDSWIEVPRSSAIGLNGPRVQVAADQLDQAIEIASRPIPQDVIDESRVTVPEYELPTCPHCGTADPILEDVKNGNSWACEACGRQWKDAPDGLGAELGGKAAE
jgi:hypothetical protein